MKKLEISCIECSHTLTESTVKGLLTVKLGSNVILGTNIFLYQIMKAKVEILP